MSCTEEEKKHGLSHQKTVEQTPGSLPHQESFHKLTEFEKPWGICRIDTNRRTETFTNILKNSVYGHGDIFHQVCLLDGQTNKILATYPPEFYPSSDQIAILEKARMNPGTLAQQGIKLADRVYGYNRSEQSGGGRTSSYNLYGLYSGDDGKGGVMIFPTNNYIICGLWHAPPEDCGAQKLENLKFKANELIEEVSDWLSSTGM
ncbi:uncharacterized protein LOC135487002 [Lineus longissimus]|uniref:uncharacterized protein LOC135487002 n=1 Tax=Lineus longissimus TaxID=88925 RepID=UPI002B4DFEC7